MVRVSQGWLVLDAAFTIDGTTFAAETSARTLAPFTGDTSFFTATILF
ncbi:hypothetical protein OSJ77_16250 [Phyllobacterium sp. 0TCS1.6C]|nr:MULTISPECIES: hypothetical protein [unclassified Phyllobacterium]MCX8281746.1 hypothetical protein [Phyllobacterium sp. 0TCS1.6C]MCX8294856.1 hypothetical protein [Phyllobacterium sp. 0TCS1.6A]